MHFFELDFAFSDTRLSVMIIRASLIHACRDVSHFYLSQKLTCRANTPRLLSLLRFPSMLFQHLRLITLIPLHIKIQRPRQRLELLAPPLQLLQPVPRSLPRQIDTIHLDPVRRTGHMQIPIPRAPHVRRLRIEAAVPAPDGEFEPPLGVDGQVDPPRAPGVVVLGRQVRLGHRVPDVAAVGRHVDAHRPVAGSARVRPAVAADVARVLDHGVRERHHQRGRDGHVLDREAV